MKDARVQLRHPSARRRLEEIIEILVDRTDAEMYCEQAVSDARHDLSVLESAGLYCPQSKEPTP